MNRSGGYRHKYRPVNPYRHPTTGALRLVIYIDDETLAEIDAEARRCNCTVSSAAMMAIEVGLETLSMERAQVSA